MSLRNAFVHAQSEQRAAFVGFVTCGYPNPQATPEIMLGMQQGGCDIIELGVPFSDPLADGPVIQYASQKALEQGMNVQGVLEAVAKARKLGVTVPILLMGYYNPLLQFGIEKLMVQCKQSVIGGFIIVDLPQNHSQEFTSACQRYNLSLVPLISPSTSEERISSLVKQCEPNGFVYIVSRMGVTGSSTESFAESLPELVEKVRKYTKAPLAVGFGVSTLQHFNSVAHVADGVVIGSQFIRVIRDVQNGRYLEAVKSYALSVGGRSPLSQGQLNANADTEVLTELDISISKLSLYGSYGEFGGQYAPESLMFALNELEQAYHSIKHDSDFWKQFKSHYPFIGRPSPLMYASRLTDHLKSTVSSTSRLWLKREDLNHTGSHKINNALGQLLLAQKLGKTKIIAETGAGQHGVATATVCAYFNIPCKIYMGKTDTERQKLNVFRMRLLGAEVVPVSRREGEDYGTLKDAINEAMRDWATNVHDTHYVVGSAIGPSPFPAVVSLFQSVIGDEVKQQFPLAVESSFNITKNLPDVLVACVGGGSNAIGLFGPFLDNESVELLGVEAGGDGVETGRHSAPLSAGRPGVLHGCRTYLMQDKDGQIAETHSISAGLDYPGVGPQHSHLKDIRRAVYTSVTDSQALQALCDLSRLEGVIPALETAHAVYAAMELCKTVKDKDIVICCSGRGDKDVEQVEKALKSLNSKK